MAGARPQRGEPRRLHPADPVLPARRVRAVRAGDPGGRAAVPGPDHRHRPGLRRGRAPAGEVPRGVRGRRRARPAPGGARRRGGAAAVHHRGPGRARRRARRPRAALHGGPGPGGAAGAGARPAHPVPAVQRPAAHRGHPGRPPAVGHAGRRAAVHGQLRRPGLLRRVRRRQLPGRGEDPGPGRGPAARAGPQLLPRLLPGGRRGAPRPLSRRGGGLRVLIGPGMGYA
ncbi:hypothetical protein SGPA1_30543 [Streptomyces misionensis JCM 4497]